ncbi:MAG: hypothetical protein E7613_04000 [Ruminococcaceae bacterium]|nr:hypothetical protein [Oscillospiraceae bacterium]
MAFILGNRAVLSAFEAVSKTEKYSHAYIIEGAEGSGKLTLARAIAATIVCNGEKACFECPTCRKIMEGIHQDVQEIRCEEGENVIKIETVRKMILDAHIKPAECNKKIFIIDGAQKTKVETQNALLQIFEEPPKNVLIFLLVPNRNLLLSTLKSRAVTLKTEKFSSEFIKEELSRRYPSDSEAIDEAVLISDGALGQAIDLMENEDKRKAVTLVKKYFSALREKASYAKLSSILSLEIKNDKAYLFSVMEYFSLALRDILVQSSGCEGTSMFFADSELLSALAKRLDRQKLLTVTETVMRILRDAGKINVTLALSGISLTLSDDFSQ